MQLAKKFIIDWSQLSASTDENKGIWEWVPPEIPDFARPEDIANLLIAYRQKLAELRSIHGCNAGTISELSDESLLKVLQYAYVSSFYKDEGRSIKTKLFAPKRKPETRKQNVIAHQSYVLFMDRMFDVLHEHDINSMVLHKFSTHMPLDNPKLLARLAQTIRSENAIAIIREENNEPSIQGIGSFDYADHNREIWGMPHLGSGPYSSGLLIEICGPGHLNVKEDLNEYTLFANKLIIHQSVHELEPVRLWLNSVSKRIINQGKATDEWDEARMSFPELEFDRYISPVSDLRIFWSKIMQQVTKLGHGGAIAIVPDHKSVKISITFPIIPVCITDVIIEAWLADCNLHKQKSMDDLRNAVERKRVALHNLISTTHSVASLSATDGCIVFDSNLNLYGFGGSIKVNRPDIEIKPCIDIVTGVQVERDEILKPLGERHKSAYYLCHEVDNAMAFVFSQDGDIRLFASDCKNVYFAQHLQVI